MASQDNLEIQDSSTICWYYNSSRGCLNGDDCEFRHVKSEGRIPCRLYRSQSGCRFGNGCRYSHDTPLPVSVPSHDDVISNPTEEAPETDTGKSTFAPDPEANPPASDNSGSGAAAPASITTVNPGKKGKKKKKKIPKVSVSQASRRSRYEDEQMGFMLRRLEALGDIDSDDGGIMGFTADECEELAMQGIKPWDPEAWDALQVLYDY